MAGHARRAWERNGSHSIDLGQGWPVVVEAFDGAAHLEPLSNGTEPELRVWRAPFMGPTTGYVVSLSRAEVLPDLVRRGA